MNVLLVCSSNQLDVFEDDKKLTKQLFFSLFHICFISCFQEEELNNNEGSYRRMTKPCKGGARTGWPQHVWALELKQ